MPVTVLGSRDTIGNKTEKSFSLWILYFYVFTYLSLTVLTGKLLPWVFLRKILFFFPPRIFTKYLLCQALEIKR